MMTRGWMGGILFILFYLFISQRNLLKIAVTSVGFILILPFIIAAKWFFRGTNDITSFPISEILNNYGEKWLEGLQYVVARLEYLSSTVFIADNIKQINIHDVLPYWAYGNIQLIFVKLFHVTNEKLGNYIVHHVLMYPEANWNVQTGLGAWVLLHPFDFFFYLYIAILIITMNNIKILRNTVKSQALILLLTFTFLATGWIAAYFNFLLSAMIMTVIIHILSLKKPKV